ncbi:MAG: ATP-dependent DNA helicase [Lachnospiraceae bacterium]|nr:ATP-dependent DNA helicase [Lachnospiraceae bacterium]
MELSEGAKTEQKPSFVIRLSVRQLVEFMLRSGDIDNRRSASPEKAMQEGSRLHRMIQRSQGVEYSAEVLLRYEYVTENYVIWIEGRADGIINESISKPKEPSITANQISINQYLINEEFDQITVDEIKCVNRKLEYVREPEPVHLAQAKVYAYIYALQNKLPLIRVRMTYCNIETEELKYFFEEYSWTEIREWFEALMQGYRKWADFAFAWRETRQASIGGVEFPFAYREGQRQLAVYVYQTIREKKKLYLEAPTGVGKTVTTLFPAIKAMGECLADKIFYLTAKTITRTVANDTLELLRRQGLRLKSVEITAKEKICPLEKAECNPEKCPYATGHFDRINDAIYDCITTKDCMDRAGVKEISEKHCVCPFELSLDLSLFADAIICDYNYAFDPHVALKRYFGDGGGGEYIFLIDEAHNLVERGREMYSAELFKEDFLAIKRKLNEVTEKAAKNEFTGKKKSRGIPLLFKLIRGVDKCNREMQRMKRECEKVKVLEEIDTFAGFVQGLSTSVAQFLEEEENTGVKEEVLEFYFLISHFLTIYERLDENYRIYTELSEDGKFMLKLLCVNPRKNLAECMERGRSSILFSATLLPIQYYKNLLGGEKTDYEVYAKSSFDNSKLGVFIGRDVTSRYTRRNADTYFRIARHISEIIGSREGNYMVFFPSFAFMKEVQQSFQQYFYDEKEMECIAQRERMTEAEREDFLGRFSRTGLVPAGEEGGPGPKPTLLAFCVLGGIFSEGIDLKEDLLIGSIIVGVGFPQICSEREIIKEFFAEKGFDYAYRYPGMNKVLQAAGRVIRTEKDVGVVALLDERFLDYSYQRMFPREWQGFSVTTVKGIGTAMDAFWARQEDKGWGGCENCLP